MISYGEHSTSNKQSNPKADWQINLLQRADNPDVNLGTVRWVFTTMGAPAWMIGDHARAVPADEKCRNLSMFVPGVSVAADNSGAESRWQNQYLKMPDRPRLNTERFFGPMAVRARNTIARDLPSVRGGAFPHRISGHPGWNEYGHRGQSTRSELCSTISALPLRML